MDVKEGQFVIVESRGGYFRNMRADRVTDKQIRTMRGHGRYDVESRHSVIFAGTKDEAERLNDKLDELRDARQREISDSRRLFEADIAPAVERRDERDRETTNLYRKGVLALLDNAKGSTK